MTVLRYANHNGRKIVTEHDTLEDALAAQLTDDALGATLDLLERDGGVVPTEEVQAARPARPYFKLAIDRPGHSQAMVGVYATNAELEAATSHWVGLVGDDRISVGTLQQ